MIVNIFFSRLRLLSFILLLPVPLLHHLRELLPAESPVVGLVVFREKELDLSLSQAAQGFAKLWPLSVLVSIHQFPQSFSLRDLLGQLLSFVHKSVIEGALDSVVLNRVFVQQSCSSASSPEEWRTLVVRDYIKTLLTICGRFSPCMEATLMP